MADETAGREVRITLYGATDTAFDQVARLLDRLVDEEEIEGSEIDRDSPEGERTVIR